MSQHAVGKTEYSLPWCPPNSSSRSHLASSWHHNYIDHRLGLLVVLLKATDPQFLRVLPRQSSSSQSWIPLLPFVIMADTATESSKSPPSPPELEFVFTSYVDADLTALRLIKVGTGDRVNVAITGWVQVEYFIQLCMCITNLSSSVEVIGSSPMALNLLKLCLSLVASLALSIARRYFTLVRVFFSS